MASKNPLLSSITNAASKVRSNNENGDEKAAPATKVAGAAVSLLSKGPLLKWGAVLVVILLLMVILGGVLGGLGRTVENLAYPAKCNPTITNEVISELEKSGQTVSPEDKAKWAADKVPNACEGGAGYNGDTYPPTTGIVTGDFGVIDALHPNGHNGTDIGGGCGAPIYAFSGGTVTTAIMGSDIKNGPVMGVIIIKHTEEFSTVYYHTKGSTTTVQQGRIVNAGDQIATQWSNGLSTGCHLHIESRINGVRTDMRAILTAAGYNYNWESAFTEAMFPPKPIGGGTGGAITAVPGSAKAEAQAQLNALGLSSSEFVCLDNLWTKESGWRVNAQNNAFSPSNPPLPEYQAYGIVQAGPGIKMAATGADWKTNPATQIRWGLSYIQGRYGTPCGAWNHSVANNWY